MTVLRRRRIVFVTAVWTCAIIAMNAGAQPLRPTRILLVYAPAPDSPSSGVFIERFRTTVRSELPPPVEFYEEFLDLDRFPSPERWPQLARYFSDKYRGLKVDLVVPVGSVALQFAVDRLRGIMPDVPIVFGLAYEHRVDLAALPTNVTGRLVSVTLGATLAMAKRLQPGANRVVVIAGSSAVDSVAMSGALADFALLHDTIRVVRWQGFAYDSLLGALRRLTPRTIVFFAHFRRDGSGRDMVPVDIMPEIARESRAPVYSYVDKLMGTGIVGGAIVQVDVEATRTALLAVRVLRREAGDALPAVELSRSPFMADWRQLHRWKLDAKRLPPGTAVLFQALGVWDRNRGPVLAALGIMLAESLLIGLLLLERRKRLRAQRALAEQAEYDRTVAELMTDAARYAPVDSPRALEDAIARLGRYARADEVILLQRSDSAMRPATRLRWTRDASSITLPPWSGDSQSGVATIEVPLVVAGKVVGLLTLRRTGDERWAAQLEDRLRAAADVIAGAIARASAAFHADEAGRQVAHMGRVAMIGELASTMSHELRQPLAAIRTNAELGTQLLARAPNDTAEVRQILEEIVADDVRASEVIDHIRLLLRKELPATAAVDVNAICHNAADLMRRDASARGIRLELSIDSRAASVTGYPIELQQVVLNLLLNALDAAAMASGERRVAIRTTAFNGSVEIVVSDSGPGLTAECRERLFESFFSTKVHGLGIGLVIVRSIVERHRGRVQAENGEAGGAVFRVRLPTLAESGREAKQLELAVSAGATAGAVS